MKIGDRVYVHGFVDEIRKDTIIIRNNGGYFGTIKSEIVEGNNTEDIVNVIRCKDCRHWIRDIDHCCRYYGGASPRASNDYCSRAERKDKDETD